MAYETKAILAGLASYIRTIKASYSSDEKAMQALQAVYEYTSDMANTEGVVLKPFDKDKKD
ncbi:MAG: hypothetical protein FWE59_07105 [Oscillospiraceae bacterium]|nr:hypothetical protein [Oscillospiraceae bacterium]